MALMICSAQETFIFDMQPRQKEHFSQLAPIREMQLYIFVQSVLDFTFNHNMISTQGVKTRLSHQSPTIHDISDTLSAGQVYEDHICVNL